MSVGLTETQRVVASMIGRGKSTQHCSDVMGPSTRTIARWKNLPAFAAEVERARESSERPDPRGTLIDALSARRDDGIDWAARLTASRALLANGSELLEDGAATSSSGPTITVLPALPS